MFFVCIICKNAGEWKFDDKYKLGRKHMREIENVIITGATGAIGTALCNKLIENGKNVYVICRPDSKRIDAIPVSEKVHIIFCDLSDLQMLPELINIRIDAFYHFAWANTFGSGRNDMDSQIKNIQYTIDAVKVANKLGCKVFIGAGSQAEYGRVEGVLRPDTPTFPENGYGIAKLCAGRMSRIECEKKGIEHIWVRILSIYGPHDGKNTMISSTIEKLLKGQVPELTEGIQQWDYLYSEDAAEALYLCALYGKNNAVYPLGSGKAYPLKEYIVTIRNIIDPSLKLGIGVIPYGPLQVMHLQADISALQKDTGFCPRYSFSEGIQRTIDWQKNV